MVITIRIILENFLRVCIQKVETVLHSIKWDDRGLAIAIAQNVDTGAILMQGFLNREAVATTVSSRKATFYSRSRSMLWTKGETSNNFINVHDIFLDCVDCLMLLLLVPVLLLMPVMVPVLLLMPLLTCYYTPVFDLLENQQVLSI
ncbi:hypothetical protein PRUPE_6G096900 [Prunus persica]|uniref:phosphoribosyl-AMP cyclohydrolase n=1 Tax=Prunus persica TaxID=3760 RepID=M5WFU2_PRUPE|nr:hypothetical protein PRUPE_6G096900 [Prunus persica]